MDALVDQKDAAKFLRVTEKFLEARRSRGGGPPFVRVGRLVRYRRETLLEWVESHEVRSTAEEP
jgi:hypothetical protein